MDAQVEKVYVAVGNDLRDGYKTLDWALKKWSSHAISVVILHVTCNLSKDFVYTPFGKLPASSVSEEKLEVLRKHEQQNTDKLLSKYLAFTGKVKAEILKVEKYDEPIHKLLIDLISGLRITKLVMGITFMKSSSWRSRSAISGSFYVHQHKPDFCEFFIICGGKLVLLSRENDEEIKDDIDSGVMVAKMKEKGNFKHWLGKMFSENYTNFPGKNSFHSCASSTSLDSPDSRNEWDKYVEDIEDYFQQLLSLNLDEEAACEEENGSEQTSPACDPELPAHKKVAEKIGYLKSKIDEAHQKIQMKRKEAKANAERYAKAEWAICLCNTRIEELETRMKEEVKKRMEIQKSIDTAKEQVYEITRDVEESKSRLSSLVELQSELSNKLHLSTLARVHAEDQLEKAVMARADMVREIEELRRQRDVLHRRIEFCREKDAIGVVSRLSELSCGYREYTAEDIRLATDGFSERLRLKSGGDWTRVYRGRISNATVAIKMVGPVDGLSVEDFQAKVKLLNNIRHPNLVAMIGFCSELKCIIFEYMHNGNLRDILFASQVRSRRRNRMLKWPDRIRIAYEVCSGLGYLHSAKPKPVIHGCLTPPNILLDRNLVAKITGLTFTRNQDQIEPRSDVRAFGVLLMHLLTGRNWGGLVEEAMTMDRTVLIQVLDEMAGKWPLDLAEAVALLAMRCLSDAELIIARVMEELDEISKKAEDTVARGAGGGRRSEEVINRRADREDSGDVPSIFICPIFQEVMKNPHVAADGHSYELEAIEEWLRIGHYTSPMTNLRLNHSFLTPNHTLRSLIQDWQNKQAALPFLT